ncbi:MAG: energy transducer TonB, partial [Caulobacteraceae bacterium]|nr:energy transducer TonB [Caulobacteraceae bacterium]
KLAALNYALTMRGWKQVGGRIKVAGLVAAALGLCLGAAPKPPSPPAALDIGVTLPDPPAGKAVVAVACRKAVSGVLSECRVYGSKSSGGPIPPELTRAAVARFEGQAMEPAKGEQVFMTGVLGDVPAAEPAGPAQPPQKADWLRMPTAAQLTSVFPSGAQEAGVSGRVILSCLVDTAGQARSCLPVVESPVGWGFGTAALVVSKYFQMKPRDASAALDETAIIPLNFTAAR